MVSSTTFCLLVATIVMTTYGRTVPGPDQLFPLLFQSVGTDENNMMPPSSGQSRLIHVIEQIIKYVSSIKSSENFIENIVSGQKDVADKIKVLTFLNKCFELTHKVIQREIDRMLGTSETMKKSSIPSPFSLEELQQAQVKINDLLIKIEKRMDTLKTWIPPTMPFLGFF
ncbi:unnamed protein product [Adineta steineri]|uniref:Uncharacterized protein n=1 Tax=Adineta steineri TaxID=433720 RepID=A0A813P6R4_9BILA|nr:unnamed protein product [Adineta steineri]CAF0739155.1 unnamed protein product [Adineta steineri]CAF0749017.1 unnamed protein product [Adineta steineri]